MGNCSKCDNAIEGHSLCASCFREWVNAKITPLKPSMMKGMRCEDVFEGFMVYNMSKFLKKDINEALKCLSYNLPNATVLMAARILETQLIEHLTIDLGAPEPLRSIGECIEALIKEAFPTPTYPPEFLAKIQRLKGMRNEAMHGKKRFKAQEAIDILQGVFAIVGWLLDLEGMTISFKYFP